MADKTPIRGAYNASSALTGLAEYATSETVGVPFGGTGATSLTDNGILIGNTTSAIQTSGDLTFDGTTFGTTAFTATGNVSLDGGTFVFNESGADKDFRVEGDTDANLFMADASVDRIGIGTATPSHLVDIEGVAHAATCFVSADLCATTKVVAPALCIGSEYVLPTADGSAGQLMCTDGSGALAFATASGGVALAGSTNNTIATVTGADALCGEANLTFTGTTLTVNIGASNDDNLILNADAGWNPKLTYTEAGAVKAGIEWDAGACKMRLQTGGTTNAIVIDCNQRVGIGTATMAQKLDVRADTSGLEVVTICNAATCGRGIYLNVGCGNASHGIITAQNNPGTAMFKFTGAGDVGIGTSIPGGIFHVQGAGGGSCFDSMKIARTGVVNITSNPYGSYILDIMAGNVSHPQRNHFNGIAPNNTSYTLWYGSDYDGTTHTARAIIFSNGNMQNVNNSYGSISDIKLKQDITDARSYWDDFKAVKFRKFRLKSEVEADADTPSMLGVVAQELETVFPSLVYSSPDMEDREVPVLDEDGKATFTTDDAGNEVAITEEKMVDIGTTTKNAKYSILSQIGLKVVQELQTRLEAAEAEIAILKG